MRAADLDGVRQIEETLGDHHAVSMAKAMSCDPVFGADQDKDLGQVFVAIQADAKMATENAESATANAWVLRMALSETEDASATGHAYYFWLALDEHGHDLHVALSCGTRKMVFAIVI